MSKTFITVQNNSEKNPSAFETDVKMKVHRGILYKKDSQEASASNTKWARTGLDLPTFLLSRAGFTTE